MSDSLVSPDPRIALRYAMKDDVGLILDFIRQLADYEKMSDEVVADEETLQASLFGDRKVAEVIIASWDGRPAGFALFFHNFSTFLGRSGVYLEDLFVVPALRGNGIGQVLLSTLAKIAVERGGGRFEWSVLDWNVDAIRFYERLGAKAMDGWTTYRVTGEALEKLARSLDEENGEQPSTPKQKIEEFEERQRKIEELRRNLERESPRWDQES